jgi:hypothetical protein
LILLAARLSSSSLVMTPHAARSLGSAAHRLMSKQQRQLRGALVAAMCMPKEEERNGVGEDACEMRFVNTIKPSSPYLDRGLDGRRSHLSQVLSLNAPVLELPLETSRGRVVAACCILLPELPRHG